MRALLRCLPCWLICSLPSLTFASFPLLLLSKEVVAGQGRLSTKSSLFMLCHHLQLPTLGVIDQNAWRFSGLHLSLISGDFPYFQHLPSKQGFHPRPSSPPSFWHYCFFLGTFIFLLLGFLDSRTHVSKLSSPGAAAQHVISLVAGDLISCISVTGGLKTCSFWLVWVIQKKL